MIWGHHKYVSDAFWHEKYIPHILVNTRSTPVDLHYTLMPSWSHFYEKIGFWPFQARFHVNVTMWVFMIWEHHKYVSDVFWHEKYIPHILVNTRSTPVDHIIHCWLLEVTFMENTIFSNFKRNFSFSRFEIIIYMFLTKPNIKNISHIFWSKLGQHPMTFSIHCWLLKAIFHGKHHIWPFQAKCHVKVTMGVFKIYGHCRYVSISLMFFWLHIN